MALVTSRTLESPISTLKSSEMGTLTHYISPYLGKVNQSILEIELELRSETTPWKMFLWEMKNRKKQRIPLVFSPSAHGEKGEECIGMWTLSWSRVKGFVSLRKPDFKRRKNGVGKAFGYAVERKKFQVCSFKMYVLTHSKLLDVLKDTEVN